MRFITKPYFETIKNTIFYFIGCLIYCAGIHIFAVPNNIAESGVTGIAMILNHLFGYPIGVLIFAINIPLFALAWFLLGRNIVTRSVGVVVLLSLMLDVTSGLFPEYTGDRLLAALFCGALNGIGLALIIIRGSSTGGTDIAGRLIQKVFPRVRIGSIIAFFNLIIALIAGFVYRNSESALYAVIVSILSSRIIDYALYGIGQDKLLLIITEHPDMITHSILSDVGRGVSILPALGGYSGQNKNVLLVAIHHSDLAEVNRILKSMDPDAFVILTNAGEIRGRGFSNSHGM